MEEKITITDDELRSIMYALTLGERPLTRNKWIKKGFKKIHKRGENALFDYWKGRVQSSEADLAYAVKTKLAYYENAVGPQKPVGPTPTTPPSLPQMLKTASTAVVNFARSGFTATDAETLAARETTCRGCDMWDSQALNGTGRCKKCGCSTWAKLRMATEKCPIGKW